MEAKAGDPKVEPERGGVRKEPLIEAHSGGPRWGGGGAPQRGSQREVVLEKNSS